MRINVFLTGCALVLIFCLGAVFNTAAQTVSGSIAGGSVAKGSKARGSIVLSIPAGLHVNSNRPSSEYAIPTTIRLTAAGARIAGQTYPRGRNRKFQFSENLINVYEGRVSFPFVVQVPAGFRGSVLKVRAVVRYQACTDEVCYPPKTAEVTMSAKVR